MGPNFEAIRQKSYSYARKVGFTSQEAKDIAQDVVEWYLTYPDQAKRRKVNHVTVDVIRRIYGDSRAKTKRQKAISLDAISRRVAPAFQPDQIDEHAKHTQAGIERAVFVLTYKWGLTLKEIGHVFGMTESGASLRLTLATSDVERAIRRDK